MPRGGQSSPAQDGRPRGSLGTRADCPQRTGIRTLWESRGAHAELSFQKRLQKPHRRRASPGEPLLCHARAAWGGAGTGRRGSMVGTWGNTCNALNNEDFFKRLSVSAGQRCLQEACESALHAKHKWAQGPAWGWHPPQPLWLLGRRPSPSPFGASPCPGMGPPPD